MGGIWNCAIRRAVSTSWGRYSLRWTVILRSHKRRVFLNRSMKPVAAGHVKSSLKGKRDTLMRILFCNIAWLLYYKGLGPGEVKPSSGGEYVKNTGDAHEKYNFLPTDLTFKDSSLPDGRYCLGFVETKATGKGSQISCISRKSMDARPAQMSLR